MKSFFSDNKFANWLSLLGLANFAVGPALILFPQTLLEVLSLTHSFSPFFLEFLGVLSLTFGFGFIIASLEPARHWGIVMVAFIFDILFIPFLIKGVYFGLLGWSAFLFISFYLFISLIVFLYILVDAFYQNTREESEPKKFYDLIQYVRTNNGRTLAELSENENVLLIFIRHFGCTFCRETVSEIAKLESSIKGKKLTPVFVHMSDIEHGNEFFSRYYDHPVMHVSDPSRVLFKSLGLKRGTLMQLFGPKVVVRGFWAGFFKGHGVGGFEGDFLQLGGYFVLSKGQIVFEHKTSGAADFFQLEHLPQR